MNNSIKLEPQAVFECFKEVNGVPRPSKHEEKMIAFLQDFGRKHGLETEVDETGNVIIRKPATKGMEHLPMVAVQSHMDMVCESNDPNFDFENSPIETYIDGEWLKAKGTTLGADDGIGVAMEMALLKADDIEHGPLECVFTRDEETGLTGAVGMKPGFMKGKLLINLDSEDEGQIFVSCAGGARTTATFPYESERLPENYYFFKVTVDGLKGGHSGDHKNISIDMQSVPAVETGMEKQAARRMLLALRAVHNGVFAMSQDLDWLVETSSNLASINRKGDVVEVVTSQRSSVASARENMSATVRAAFELGGAEVVTNEGYPGWKMNPNSVLLKVAKESYERVFNKEPQILAIHAGLECGLFSEKYPELDMVSFGPTLRGVRSPEERLLIPTVKMVWDHLLDILKHLPVE